MVAPPLGGLSLPDATELSGVCYFLECRDFRNGLDTVLGAELEGGQNISGCQAQSIKSARAFILDVSLSIFDEPTSELDGVRLL